MNPILNYVSASEEKIFGFWGKFDFLALTYPTVVDFEGARFPSAENAFHAAKCPDPQDFLKFEKIDPFKAKQASVGLAVYKDWVDRREGVMRKIIFEKFKNPTLQKKLLETGNAKLINANHWGDKFWGVSPEGEGQNKLGLLLEEVRESLKNGGPSTKPTPVVEDQKKEKFSIFKGKNK